MRADIVTGAVFPDYALTDHAGKRRTLSDLQGPDPLILVLSRGGYCRRTCARPKVWCNCIARWTSVIAGSSTISTDNMLTTNEYRTGVGANWTFLSDPGRKVQKDLDIAEYTEPEHNPMIPHVIVLEPGLVIFKIYNGYWFFGRPTIEELRQDLRARADEMSSGLGHHDARTQSRVGTGRTRSLLSLWQDLRAGVSGARVSGGYAYDSSF